MSREISDTVRLLLVEDDLELAEMYRTKFELDGYAVTIASDGGAAFTEMAQDPPDLIFLDIRLPDIDGLDLLARIRSDERFQWIPVVILTNYDDPEFRQRGAQLGTLDYLIKAKTTPVEVSSGVRKWSAATEPERPVNTSSRTGS
jgi:DNA-binding response OmpR family regulator